MKAGLWLEEWTGRMKFFTNPDEFTHLARFYGVPCYAKITDDDFVLQGRNVVFDWALVFTTWFHNEVVERVTQTFAALSGRDYEPGFPIYVQELERSETRLNAK